MSAQALDGFGEALAAVVRQAVTDALDERRQEGIAQLLTIGQVAERLSLSAATVRDYIRRGLIPTVRFDPDDERGKPLVSVATLEHIIRQREQWREPPCPETTIDNSLTRPGKTRGRQVSGG